VKEAKKEVPLVGFTLQERPSYEFLTSTGELREVKLPHAIKAPASDPKVGFAGGRYATERFAIPLGAVYCRHGCRVTGGTKEPVIGIGEMVLSRPCPDCGDIVQREGYTEFLCGILTDLREVICQSKYADSRADCRRCMFALAYAQNIERW
jgi:hypothetical protein